MKNLKILVEQHSDGYVAYPLGIRGVVVGQGFGPEVLRSAFMNFDFQKAPEGGDSV